MVARDSSIATVAAAVDFGGGIIDRFRFPFSGGAMTAHFHTDP